MRKSSSVDADPAPGATRWAYRVAAAPFLAATAYLGAVFVASLGTRQIRSGVLSYAIVTAVCAIGLLRMRRWGRSLALVAAVGIAGIGVLSLLSVVVAGGNLAGAIVMTASGFGTAAWLARPVFTLPEQRRA